MLRNDPGGNERSTCGRRGLPQVDARIGGVYALSRLKRFAVFVGLVLSGLSLLGVSSAAVLPLAGNLDPSFGNGGIVAATAEGMGGIAVQPDGKIVVAGTSNSEEFRLARYLPDGSSDPSFGDGGSVETQVGEWAFATAIALQPDGKIVVAGSSYQGGDGPPLIREEFTLARYNPDGSLDTSFGNDGITNTVIPEQQSPNACFPASQAAAHALVILPGGDIVVAGSAEWDDGCSKFTNTSFALARYTPDGSLDPTFGDGGIAQTASPGVGAALDVQSDGELVATEGNALAGYAPDGSLNLAFDPDPKLESDDTLTLQAGKIVVAGASRSAKRSRPWFPEVARYKTNGRLDPTFGAHGQTGIKRLVGLLPTALLTQNDGKLLVAASSPYDQPRGAVVRLLPNGRLDTHFGRGGIVSFADGVGSLATQEDGRILVGRSTNEWALDRLIGGNNCVVPRLRGKRVSKASFALKNAYCSLGRISKRVSRSVIRGRVVSTAPLMGTRLPGGSKVDLVVSRGR